MRLFHIHVPPKFDVVPYFLQSQPAPCRTHRSTKSLKNPHTELAVRAPRGETHRVLRNIKNQASTVFGSTYAKIRCEKKTKAPKPHMRRRGKGFATTAIHSSLASQKTVSSRQRRNSTSGTFSTSGTHLPYDNSDSGGSLYANIPRLQRAQTRRVVERCEVPLTPSCPECSKLKCAHSLTPYFASYLAP